MCICFLLFFSTFSVSHTCETLENDDQRAVALQAPLPCFCIFRSPILVDFRLTTGVLRAAFGARVMVGTNTSTQDMGQPGS